MNGFKEVFLTDLSDITVNHFISEHKPLSTPEYLVLKYTGTYQSGAAGRSDALFIVSTAKAAQEAWFTKMVILDFSELSYQWGDEMAWVYGLGWDRVLRFDRPLAIIVGDLCKDALKSLAPDDFEARCVEDLASAQRLARKQLKAYEHHLKNVHGRPAH